jgi:hypothetical protein
MDTNLLCAINIRRPIKFKRTMNYMQAASPELKQILSIIT